MTRIWIFGALLLLTAAASAQTNQTAQPAQPPLDMPTTTLHPMVTVPMLQLTPRLDGTIDVKNEYYPSTRTHDFICIDGPDKGSAGLYPSYAVITYTDKALYVIFKTEMPAGSTPKTSVTEGQDQGMEDDAFEMFLVQGDRDGEQFQIGGNSAGVTWHRRFDPLDKLGTSKSEKEPGWDNWNPKLNYRVHVDKSYWTGEWVIPWSEFGLTTPKPGETWRANFVSRRHIPDKHDEGWAFGKAYRDPQSYGRLVFGANDTPYFTFSGGWKDAWEKDRYGMWPGIYAPPSWGRRRFETTLNVLSRDVPEDSGTFYTEMQDRRKQAVAEGGTMVSLAQDVADELKTFQPAGLNVNVLMYIPENPAQVSKRRGDIGYAPLYKMPKGGDYIFHYYVRDVTDPAKPFTVAGGVMPFRLRTGVQMRLTPYLLSRQSVVATIDTRAVDATKSPARIRGFITPEKSDKVLTEKTVDYPTNAPTQDVELPTKDLPVDRVYKVTTQVLNSGGEVITSIAAPLKRPADPDWWVNRHKYGSQPEVPEPWTPVKWKDGSVEVWGRSISLKEELFPCQINSQGENILAGPMRLELRKGGQVVTWQNKQSKLTEQRPGSLSFEASQAAGGVKLRATHRLEFDGFSEYHLYIEPSTQGQAAEVDALELVIPLKASYAQFIHNYDKAPGPGTPLPQKRFVGRLPDRYASPVMITTWIGNDDQGGLEFSCESARDWFIPKDKTQESIVVERKGDVVEARFRFIGGPMRLDRTRHLRFGLVVTPTKAIPPEWANWKIDATAAVLAVPGDPAGGKIISRENGAWVEKYSDTIPSEKTVKGFFEYYDGYDVLVNFNPQDWATGEGSPWPTRVTDPKIAALIKDQERRYQEKGIRVCRYGGWGIWTNAREWDPWGKEMVAVPRNFTLWDQMIGTYESPFVEWAVGSWALNARELGVRGVRFDTVFPWHVSQNPYYDEAWVSETDGQTYGKFALFRARVYAKRLYRIFHGGEVKGGVVYHPAAGPPMMIIESFVNIREAGEGYYMHSPSLKDGYVQERMRVWNSGKPYGFIEQASIKGDPLMPNNRIGALLAAGLQPRMMHRPNTDFPITDAHVNRTPSTAIRDAWEWVDLGTAKWRPHWKNQQEVQSTAAPDGERYVSFHLQPGKKILLVATNYEKHDATITVTLDLAKLGFARDAKLQCRDAISGEELPVSNGTVSLKCGPELYRYVKIASAENLD